MSEIKTRKYRCNGCGEDRPCYLTTNQEPHTLDYMQIDDLKCVLDETNQTSYNWEEVEANGVNTGEKQCNLPVVVFSEAELKAKLDQQKEEMRQWLEGEGYELLAERL